jgi:2-phospho-L-lactate guanylyltransferase (CobY/MobA/RfbA family)
MSDAVEQAVRQVMQAGGDVEVLQDDLALKGHEHIGALLRYYKNKGLSEKT